VYKKMKLRPYDLPDVELLEGTSSNLLVWEPGFLCIVLGQSNGLEESVNVENVEADGVPVYKRPSGGEAVVLSPGMLVISILKLGDRFRSPRLYFDAYNGQIIRVLRELGIRNIGMKGISDICIGNKKILGSSIYRNKDRVLYHGVLNVAGAVDTIERYLRHPVREPAYRKGRGHRDFVTSFVREGYGYTVKEIRAVIIEQIGKSPFS
jgi:lipoate-protein ligase A